MFEVGVDARFTATHALRGDFGPASSAHGHDYRVEVVVRGETLQPDGTLVDLVALRAAVEQVASALDGRHLDDLPAFRDFNSTAEVVARHFVRQVRERLPAAVLSIRAVVWESPEAFAAFAD